MTALKKVKSHPDVAEYFKQLPFYNQHIQNGKFKHLKNIDLLSELYFYEELNVINTNHVFILVFIDSMQLINYSLEELAKNLTDDDFKYLTGEFGSENLELVKQKDAYPYEYMDSFKRFGAEILPYKKMFSQLIKKREKYG